MTSFPWSEAMRLGLGVLRLPPDAFWRMTPRELVAAAAGIGGATGFGAPISRARFDDLRQRFPDKTKKTEPDHG